jgi:predicted nucleic acid-binding Zn ribbon protein
MCSLRPLDGPSPERSALVGCPQPVCVVCGGPRELRKREACSDKCRAALSRRRRTQLQTTRDQETRAALEAIAGLVQVTLSRLGRDTRR